MQFSGPVEKWLAAVFKEHMDENSRIHFYREVFEGFLAFSGKTAHQIIDDYGDSVAKSKAVYSELLLDYTAFLQKELPARRVKERVDVVRSFFDFFGLPLGFGVKAHFRFFFV